MDSILSLARKLVPFATPGTPLLQDLLYTGAIIAVVVVLVAERIQRRSPQEHAPAEHTGAAGNRNGRQAQENPLVAATHEYDDNQVIVFENDNSEPEAEGDEGNILGNAEPGPALLHHGAPDGGAGPAGEGAARQMQAQRTIGAKKAKSLARKDQRRAYHEFLRSQGAAQRAQDAEGEAAREAELAHERSRRAAAESAIEAKRAAEREAKRAEEARVREREKMRREGPVRLCREALERRSMVSVWEIVDELKEADVDEVWVEKMLRAAGVIGRNGDGSITMMASTGWIVRVGTEDMARAYEIVASRDRRGDENGRIEFAEIGRVLQGVLEEKGRLKET